jgi:hypothetical protein
MNIFLRLMHEGLTVSTTEQRTINASHEFAKSRKPPEQIRGRLKTAFPVLPAHVIGTRKSLSTVPDHYSEIQKRFRKTASGESRGLAIQWEREANECVLTGTAKLNHRIQPFTLILDSVDRFPIVRCLSPVGRVDPDEEMEAVLEAVSASPMKVGAIVSKDERSYDLTVEGEVLFSGDDEVNRLRIAALIERVVLNADILEQRLLPGRDESLEAFRDDLRKEADHDG